MKKINCLRCDSPMVYYSTEHIQLGKTGWLVGDLPNLFAGAITAQIYICPQCKKIELYYTEDAAQNFSLPQKTCPKCGAVHDFDYPRCPTCKYSYFGD